MDENLLKQAEELADRDYAVVVSIEGETPGKALYMAKNPELIGCMAQGDTLEEAIKNLREARVDYIHDSLENNSPIPEPASQKTIARGLETADTTIHLDYRTIGLKIETFIPPNVPSEPVVRRIRQYSEA